MLQPKHISQTISQVLSPHGLGPISVSLLSSKGLPLSTVSVSNLDISSDNLKVFSLLAINAFHQQPKAKNPDLDDWVVMDVDGHLRSMVKRFSTEKGTKNQLYVVIFYFSNYEDALAKAQIDALAGTLEKELQGYVAA
ncbi:hypothetical protein CJJ07_000140 [Candidozyma auris]|nr:hypothetical protein CJJ07_000140 [[Candida] auris]